MNKPFREGVFSVEPDVLKEQPVLLQLARLFAQLHASKKAFVDSAPFIVTLELDNGVQQDNARNVEKILKLHQQSRVDATRSIKLRSLPAVLNFQLKRCVFLPKTTTKKKITSPFCFPGELDMGDRLSEHSQSELRYDLSAVLIHQGSAVNSGHYVAHIKDENTGQWWKFDDEQVSNLGRHPFADGLSDSAAKSVQTDPFIHPSCSELMNVVAIGSQPNSSESDVLNTVQNFSSRDAYMLMYIRRYSKNGGENAEMESGGFKMENDSCLAPQNDVCLPSDLGFVISCRVIDNNPIQCLHGKVPVSKIGGMKRLSSTAWTMLFSKVSICMVRVTTM
ncbi:hypothetical protein RHGRI_011937 [Rhododendron griersonianum]|uniref:ubiquitinyl hydrolase 1 n=1 Tax=Rhododendron griersonianum TaxID=479676 RepID=A0AAV6KNT1_9ERIC|nr:hypothetical protein RHGRI_011937 [Rhododendron griersonianum]